MTIAPLALRLAAILKEKQLGGAIREIKTDGAIAANEGARDAAAGAHAVDLVNAEVGANVKFAPGFDKNGAACFFGKKNFEGRALVFEVGDGRGGLESMVIEAV